MTPSLPKASRLSSFWQSENCHFGGSDLPERCDKKSAVGKHEKPSVTKGVLRFRLFSNPVTNPVIKWGSNWASTRLLTPIWAQFVQCGGWDSNPRTPKGRDAPSEARPDLESRTFSQALLPPRTARFPGFRYRVYHCWTVTTLLVFLRSRCDDISMMMLQYLASWPKYDTRTLL